MQGVTALGLKFGGLASFGVATFFFFFFFRFSPLFFFFTYSQIKILERIDDKH